VALGGGGNRRPCDLKSMERRKLNLLLVKGEGVFVRKGGLTSSLSRRETMTSGECK